MHEPLPFQPPTRLQEALETGRFAITAEVAPRASGNPNRLLERVLPLRGLADAVNVTDCAGAHVSTCALAAAALLVSNGIEPVLQMTCRDRNRIAMQADLLGAAVLGVRNFMFLRGDEPSAGDEPNAKPVFDVDARDMLRAASGLSEHGRLPSRRAVDGMPRLFLGAADTPIDPPAEWRPDGLRAKVEAGASFVQTQFCMDAGVLARYAARLRETGLADRVRVLVGIAPLASARSARWMREHLFGTTIPDRIIARMDAAADPNAEGQAICLELLREFAEVDGVAGAHLMAPMNPSSIAPVIEAFKAGR
jgi:methylenetetrahydrofolate reductase (NADPH)